MEKQLIPQLRFQEFKGNWKFKVLSEISKVSSGGTPNRSEKKYWGGDIPWISTTLIDFNTIQNSEEYITKAGLKNSSAKLFPIGTILMAMYGQGKTRGKVAVLGVASTTNQACCAIIPNDCINNKYLFQYLVSRYNEVRRLSNEGGQQNLSGTIIKSIRLNIPNLPEQQKIALFLTDIDDKITKLTQKKALLEQHKKGVMQYIFNQELRFKDENGNDFSEWEDKKLGEIFKFKQGFQFSIEEQSEKKFKNSVDFIRIINVTSNVNDKRYVLDPGKEHHISENDLFMVRYGDAGRVSKGFEGIIANNMFRLLPKFKINNSFFFYSLGRLYNKIHSLSGSSTMPAISFSTIDKLKIKVPCLKEQTKIANFLSDIDIKIEVLNTKIEKNKAFKKGLLQQMFV